MKLALFDLDNTLLPLDSDHTWSEFLIKQGIVNADEFKTKNDYFFEQYKKGTLNIDEFLEFQLKPLSQHNKIQLDTWHQQFMQQLIQPAIHEAALNLVKKHRQNGETCLVITATNRFITQPIVKQFGIEPNYLIATEPEFLNGQFTGQVAGQPCFQQGKIECLKRWLKHNQLNLHNCEQITFYSDSINDLPLLKLATHPVATNPDQQLRMIALQKNWPILELF